MADKQLVELLRYVPAPVEQIVETDLLLTMANYPNLGGKRVALLACGHKVVTGNRLRAACAECHTMILNGEDYDAFRRRGRAD